MFWSFFPFLPILNWVSGSIFYFVKGCLVQWSMLYYRTYTGLVSLQYHFFNFWYRCPQLIVLSETQDAPNSLFFPRVIWKLIITYKTAHRFDNFDRWLYVGFLSDKHVPDFVLSYLSRGMKLGRKPFSERESSRSERTGLPVLNMKIEAMCIKTKA